jgi:hypothetical protein
MSAVLTEAQEFNARDYFLRPPDKAEFVKLAVEAAELVLPVFEQKYPNDNRPRKAIEAAKAWLDSPDVVNAAVAAGYAAHNAANAAVYAVAYAADAAANAAYAANAGNAANAAVAANNAANAAAYAAEAAAQNSGCTDTTIARIKQIQDEIKELRSRIQETDETLLSGMLAEAEPKGADQAAEFVACAAVRFPDGAVYKGLTHFDAYAEAAKAKGIADIDDIVWSAEDGFVTNTGRYVDRDEGFVIARKARQRIEPGGPNYLQAHELFQDPRYVKDDAARGADSRQEAKEFDPRAYLLSEPRIGCLKCHADLTAPSSVIREIRLTRGRSFSQLGFFDDHHLFQTKEEVPEEFQHLALADVQHGSYRCSTCGARISCFCESLVADPVQQEVEAFDARAYLLALSKEGTQAIVDRMKSLGYRDVRLVAETDRQAVLSMNDNWGCFTCAGGVGGAIRRIETRMDVIRAVREFLGSAEVHDVSGEGQTDYCYKIFNPQHIGVLGTYEAQDTFDPRLYLLTTKDEVWAVIWTKDGMERTGRKFSSAEKALRWAQAHDLWQRVENVELDQRIGNHWREWKHKRFPVSPQYELIDPDTGHVLLRESWVLMSEAQDFTGGFYLFETVSGRDDELFRLLEAMGFQRTAQGICQLVEEDTKYVIQAQGDKCRYTVYDEDGHRLSGRLVDRRQLAGLLERHLKTRLCEASDRLRQAFDARAYLLRDPDQEVLDYLEREGFVENFQAEYFTMWAKSIGHFEILAFCGQKDEHLGSSRWWMQLWVDGVNTTPHAGLYFSADNFLPRLRRQVELHKELNARDDTAAQAPVAEARQKRAFSAKDYFLSLPSTRYFAIFTAQEWVNDYAVDVDPHGLNIWDVTDFILSLSPAQREAVMVPDSYESDALLELPNAPQWAANWAGPFYVTVVAEEGPPLKEAVGDFDARAYLLQSNERWVFTKSELKHPETCHSKDEFIGYPERDIDDEIRVWPERGVIVYRNGQVSNRYSDGTAGVPDDERDLVDAIETLVKPREQVKDLYDELAYNWYDVVIDAEGNFVQWAEKPPPLWLER